MKKKDRRPGWWPKNPYPTSVFTLDTDGYCKLLPNGATRTAISGHMANRTWVLADEVMWEAVKEHLIKADSEA